MTNFLGMFCIPIHTSFVRNGVCIQRLYCFVLTKSFAKHMVCCCYHVFMRCLGVCMFWLFAGQFWPVAASVSCYVFGKIHGFCTLQKCVSLFSPNRPKQLCLKKPKVATKFETNTYSRDAQ